MKGAALGAKASSPAEADAFHGYLGGDGGAFGTRTLPLARSCVMLDPDLTAALRTLYDSRTVAAVTGWAYVVPDPLTEAQAERLCMDLEACVIDGVVDGDALVLVLALASNLPRPEAFMAAVLAAYGIDVSG